jgi:eukaryotic-like serine/threonine-protein kinase
MSSLRPDDVVANKFVVERLLGRGGMGAVYLARHRVLGQPVALKVLDETRVTSGEARARFLREARAAAQIRSEHVARVVDVEALDDGSPVVIMEYLEGRDLAAELAAVGPLPPALASDYVRQACRGVAAAHALGIVHRDLKPANLFLAARDSGWVVKVLDFGVAKVPADGGGRLTGPATVMGSPAYMAPEQLRATGAVDARADVWSLGVTLFELLSGELPFAGASVHELARSVTHDEPRPLAPGTPAALATVVGLCLAKDPAHRIQSVEALGRALAPATSVPAAPPSPTTGAGPLRETEEAYQAPHDLAQIESPVAREAPTLAPAEVEHVLAASPAAGAPRPTHSAWRWALGACALALAPVAYLQGRNHGAAAPRPPAVEAGVSPSAGSGPSTGSVTAALEPAAPAERPAPLASIPAPTAKAPSEQAGRQPAERRSPRGPEREALPSERERLRRAYDEYGDRQ